MAYGELKVDSITFTDGGSDTTVSVSGLVQNPTFSGDITVTGTISGAVIQGGTLVSGATVSGTAGEFGTITGNTAGFTTVTGTTVTGTTANFATLSGTTVTGGTGQFTSLTSTTATITSGVFASGTAAAPSIAFTGDLNTGIYSPGADQVAVATGGSGRLFVDASGNVGIGTSSISTLLHLSGSSTSSLIRIESTSVGASSFNGAGAGLDLIGGNSNTSAKYMPAIKFGSADSNFTTTNPKYGASITAEASENYNSDTSGGMHLAFWTSPNSPGTGSGLQERLRVTSAGLVGIGTTSPGSALEIDAAAATSPFIAKINTAEAARIDSSGRLLVGTSTYAGNGRLVAAGNTGGSAGTLDITWTGSRPTAANTDIGYIRWYVAENSSSNAHYASINATSDGASSGTGDIPGRLVFSTTADGASSPTERMRIDKDGNVLVGTLTASIDDEGHEFRASSFAAHTVSGGVGLRINRLADDGALVEFFQATSNEGSISVSGSTVSYNGAHLSRWSQLSGGAERTEILRGSVLSNIDEMCEWGDEDNEQLNRMKVSDVEGDKNVSGVFQAWDDDDDTYTNDFYCAMTGDFIIRIGAGVTVERGELLMSAGDGTAKPQADDLVRSCTVAKVTSTTVSCTHPDGSYCVPCVLMAC